MVLEKCKVCSYKISTKSTSCPNCGTRLTLKTRGPGYALGGVCLLIFILGFIGVVTRSSRSSSTVSSSSSSTTSGSNNPVQDPRESGPPLDEPACSVISQRVHFMALLRDKGLDKTTILRAMEDPQGALDSVSRGRDPGLDLREPHTVV